MEKPIVEYNSKGASGNIYYILGLVQKALRKQQRINDYNELRDKVFESKSYEQALREISKYVDLVDMGEIE